MKKRSGKVTRCKTCKNIAGHKLNEPVANPWPQEPEQLQPAPTPQRERDVRPDQHSACIAAVRTIAETLACFSEEGFEDIHINGQRKTKGRTIIRMEYRALQRLALIADQDLVCKDTFKKASHCGGVQPDGVFLIGWSDSPNCADAGNEIYEAIVNKLLHHCQDTLKYIDSKSHDRIQFLAGLGREKKADTIEAALAAADYACKMANKEEMTWATLTGGAHVNSDIPT